MIRGGIVDAQLKREVNLLHANVCQALADPTRILILYALGEAPRHVSELADSLEAPQSTVSRHLKVLKDAGLVIEEPHGTRRIYRLHDQGVAAVEEYLRQVWGDAATRFRLMAENTRPKASTK